MSLVKDLDMYEREALEELLKSQGWKALMKAIDRLVAEQDNSVLTYNLSSGAEGLAYRKAESEGARKLRYNIQTLREKLKTVSDN